MNPTINPSPKHIAFLMTGLSSGGIQRAVLNLLDYLVKKDNLKIDLVLVNLTNDSTTELLKKQIPPQVRIINLQVSVEYRLKVYLKILPALMNYLRQEKPEILFSVLPLINVLSIIAKKLTFSSVRLFIVEQTLFFNEIISIMNQETDSLVASSEKKESKWLYSLMSWFYPQADDIIAICHDLATYVEKTLNLKSNSVKVIYNPVIDQKFLEKSQLPVNHPWFNTDTHPIFLGVGRLTLQKDFTTLITAFAKFRETNQGKLIILGEGELRPQLEQLIQDLNLENDVCLLGFVDNPYAYMSKANVFVLSSLWEGFGNVVAEAMAYGCQVIATDCPYGPSEILEQGKHGFLVPMKDSLSLAKAMQNVLIHPKNSEDLKQRSKAFTIEKSFAKYWQLINQK